MIFLRINLLNFVHYHRSSLSWYHSGERSPKKYLGNGVPPIFPSTTLLYCETGIFLTNHCIQILLQAMSSL